MTVKYNTKGEVMLMGDINAHINCNETDFIINDSDNVWTVFFFTKKLHSGQYASFEKHSNPTNN